MLSFGLLPVSIGQLADKVRNIATFLPRFRLAREIIPQSILQIPSAICGLQILFSAKGIILIQAGFIVD